MDKCYLDISDKNNHIHFTALLFLDYSRKARTKYRKVSLDVYEYMKVTSTVGM
jgi:hypothetical protein